jgi:hypothetical protein
MTLSGVMAHRVIEALFSENMKPLVRWRCNTDIHHIRLSELARRNGIKGAKGTLSISNL